MSPSPQPGGLSRRELLAAVCATGLTEGSCNSAVAGLVRQEQYHKLRVSELEVFPVRLPRDRKWLFLRLRTNQGINGIAEATLGGADKLPELKTVFGLIKGESPFNIRQFRQRGWPQITTGGLKMAVAFSAIEQALWDIAGKALQVPAYDLFGGKLRDKIIVYANINNATTIRSAAAFAENAQKAAAEGFQALKAAPFDGFPPLDAPGAQIEQATDTGIKCIRAIRETVGDDVKIKVDFHSYFDVRQTVDIAGRVAASNLSWIEEPIDPQDVVGTKAIGAAVHQRLAGGEFLFALREFGPLCRTQSVDVLMPDVQACGGLLEGQRISTAAELHGLSVAPHNAHGPVATAASVQLSAFLPNFEILEYQWGEVPWRAELIDPPESVNEGQIYLTDRPGFGVDLNDRAIAEHL